ncbi:MAG: undecaprenyldiphospho-muramoylpentapeptide beta-N-acetylglucosaminyltransferase [Clostridia bacterium]|nr:undecaprenyldiphospho-muramoylpentapeptide beta-N-acetylglucosaminyltransferase [Clostridia bacterium]
MHILFAGGGTAGHINPALAIAGYVKQMEPDTKISYIGTAKKLEAKLVPAAGYDFYNIDVAGFQRKISVKNIGRNFVAVYKMFASSHEAKKLLKKLKPDLVIGTGGYVSGPVVREAQRLGIKTAIHEQNAFPGVTTKMLAPHADAVMLAMPEAEKYLNLTKKPIITGNPIRLELLRVHREEARKKLGIGEDRPLVLSFGGSLGARKVNEAVLGLAKWNVKNQVFYHIHGTGKEYYKDFVTAVPKSRLLTVKEYIDNMDICMAAADLVICRCGAITLGEISACGKPAILIPSPNVAENHQYHNGMTLKKAGSAEMIEEKDLTAASLIAMTEKMIGDPERLRQMSATAKENAIIDANERIYQVIQSLF